jgi:thiol-disulfide isomerase/thioredoxin
MVKLINVNNSENLEKYNSMVGNIDVVTMFYMPGCGFCEMLKPIFASFENYQKTNFPSKELLIARVRNDYLQSIKGYNSVSGYPTIVFIKKGNISGQPVIFSSERNLENLNTFVSHQSGGKRMKRRSMRRKRVLKHKKTLKQKRKNKRKTMKYKKRRSISKKSRKQRKSKRVKKRKSRK